MHCGAKQARERIQFVLLYGSTGASYRCVYNRLAFMLAGLGTLNYVTSQIVDKASM